MKLVNWIKKKIEKRKHDKAMREYMEKVKTAKKMLRAIDTSMKDMAWSRQQRRQFWRDFIKKDVESKVRALNI